MFVQPLQCFLSSVVVYMSKASPLFILPLYLLFNVVVDDVGVIQRPNPQVQATVAQQLVRLVEANPDGLVALDPIVDMKIKDMASDNSVPSESAREH